MPGLSMPWDIVNSTTQLSGVSDYEDINMGSYGSMELAPASAVSANSDTYVFPLSPSVFGSPGGASPLLDLVLPSMLTIMFTYLSFLRIRLFCCELSC